MSQKTVLVVDDDNLVCWALRKELANHRLNARIAESGAECLRAVRRTVLISFFSTSTSRPDGLDLLKSIREISPETRVVIISGDGNFQGKERALSEGACNIWEKPFDISLVGRIAESIFLEFPRKRKHPRYLCSIPLRLSILAPIAGGGPIQPRQSRRYDQRCRGRGVRVNTGYPLQEGQGVRLRSTAKAIHFRR